AADASPFLSSIAADQIPVGVLFESTSMNLQEFFLDSDEEMPPGMSRVAADPDSDDEVVAEILFREVKPSYVIDPLRIFFSSDSDSGDDDSEYSLPYNADDGLDLWRDVNMLCRSLHADDVEE
nr:hypothetical protein [Tanacetum cinerariifolium]